MKTNQAAWYLPGKDNQAKGPYRTEELIHALKQGKLHAGILCWREGMSDWCPLDTVEPFIQIGLTPGSAPAQHKGQAPGLDALSLAFTRAMRATRKTANVVSIKVAMSKHEKQRQQLFCTLGSMVYQRNSEIDLFSEEPFAELLSQIRAREEAITALQHQIEGMEAG